MKYRLFRRNVDSSGFGRVEKVAEFARRQDAEAFLELSLELWFLDAGECYELVELERSGRLRSLVSFRRLHEGCLLQDPMTYRDEHDLVGVLIGAKPLYQLKKMSVG